MPVSPVLERGRNSIAPPVSSTDFYGNSRLLDSDLNGSMLTDLGVAESAAARLHVSGQAVPRGNLVLEVKSPPAFAAVLAIGAAPGAALVAPWGYLGIDVTAGLFVLGWPVNSAASLPIPAEVMPGNAFVFQALAAGQGGANLTNAVDVRIR
jgi:hypothetical protein